MVARLIEQRLTPEARAEMDGHIAQCPSCRALVREVAGSYFAERRAQAPADAAFPPAEFDEYRVVRLLGKGAMGQVYLCQDTVLDRQVAIKFVSAATLDENTRARFLLEARAIARLSHPNVVTVHRVGEVAGRPYLVSEYVRGRSLDQLALPLPWQDALRIGIGLARGLACAHKAGVLHRDIKPANVVLTEEGEVKLLDFGLAKLLDVLPGASLSGPLQEEDAVLALAGTSPAMTAPDVLLGTPSYMAPEAWRAEGPAPSMDIYSLGALLYELAGGRRPHSARDVRALREAVLQGEPLPLREIARGVDRRFAAVVDRCLRRRPGDRFSSAPELCRALERLASPAPRWPSAGLFGVAALCAVAGAVLWSRPHLRSPRSTHRMVAPPGMVYLAGGPFLMGSTEEEAREAYDSCRADPHNNYCRADIYERELMQHQVEVSPFFLDETEVTNLQFVNWLTEQHVLRIGKDNVVRDGGGTILADVGDEHSGIVRQESGFAARAGFEERPVVLVTWSAAARYCQSHKKRLPSEAEWEFAARGAGRRRFPWGDKAASCEGVVFGRRPGYQCERSAAEGMRPVGRAQQDRTPEGVYDLGGNAAEWVMDRFPTDLQRYPECPLPCKDPQGAAGDAEFHVIRGGSADQAAHACRGAGRGRGGQQETPFNVGFRCARGGT